MEINLNFVLFEELQEKEDGAVARMVVIRESKDADSAFEEGTADLHPLD